MISMLAREKTHQPIGQEKKLNMNFSIFFFWGGGQQHSEIRVQTIHNRKLTVMVSSFVHWLCSLGLLPGSMILSNMLLMENSLVRDCSPLVDIDHCWSGMIAVS